MSKWWIVLLAMVVGLLLLVPVSAQNGAVKETGETPMFAWFWDGNNVLSIHATNPSFGCEPGHEDVLLEWMAITRPDGSIKYKDQGNYFTLVLSATPDDLFSEGCALVNDPSRIIAEGIVYGVWNDNDPSVSGNRTNIWGTTMAGTLYDYAGICGSGMVDFNVVRRWKLLKKDVPECLPNDCPGLINQVVKGPRLSCPD
jgi:hypothetical protein